MKIKSNSQCPCGSGKKYKRCCKVAGDAVVVSASSSQLHEQYTRQGLSLFNQKKISLSIDCFSKCIQLKPGDANSHYFLALALGLSGSKEYDKEIYHYSKAAKLKPGFFEAYNNLGNVYRTLGRLEEAEKCFHEALKQSPNNALVLNNLGNIQHSFNAIEAVDYFRRALKADPKYKVAYSNLLISLHYLLEIPLEQLFQEHRQFSLGYEQPIIEVGLRRDDSASVKRKIKIGYISADFRSHPVADFIEPIFLNYDKEKFEVCAYYNNAHIDDRTKRLMGLVDEWRNTVELDDKQLAKQIGQDNIDILIDLSGHTSANRLLVFPYRAAPIQISWIGYPGSTGLDSMDYYLTDKIADSKEDQQYYTENLIFLEAGLSCYMPPGNAPEISQLPGVSNGYITFGSLNILSKINDHVIDLWCRVLHENINSKLLVFRDKLKGAAATSLKEKFISRGIDESRLEFYSTMGSGNSHLHAYSKIDVLLDSFPWSGHTTSCEALWMGVPVVTFYGNRHASRLCASVLNQINLSELIAYSEDEYVGIAVLLSQNMNRLIQLRQSLRAIMMSSLLCDASAYTKKLEQVFLGLWGDSKENNKN